MSLSLRQKSNLYRELGQLLRAGKTFPAAVQLLHGETHGSVHDLLGRLKTAVDGGATVGDAFAAQYPLVSPLESSIISACERTGRLDQGCFHLSEYYAELDTAKRSIIRKSLYPLFVLHFGIFVSGLPARILGGSNSEYLKGSIGVLVLIYLCGIVLWLGGSLLLFEGARNTAIDQFLRNIPGVGKLRRAFALARFCATYEMQLQSGVNVMDSLESSAKASQSALMRQVIHKALPMIRAGAQVGPLLSGSGAFPEDMVRAIKIGEETGELDAELKRLSHEYRAEAASRLEMLAAVLTKGLYFFVLCYTGWRIIQGYVGYLNQAEHMLDQ